VTRLISIYLASLTHIHRDIIINYHIILIKVYPDKSHFFSDPRLRETQASICSLERCCAAKLCPPQLVNAWTNHSERDILVTQQLKVHYNKHLGESQALKTQLNRSQSTNTHSWNCYPGQ